MLSRAEIPDLGFRTPNVVVTNKGTNVSLDLDTDQGEGVEGQIKFAAKKLDDRMSFHMSSVSGNE